MSKKKTQETNGADNLMAGLDRRGWVEIWSLYPFREGKLSAYYPPNKMPSFGAGRKPDDEALEFVERVIDAPLTFAGLAAFLQTKCNAQNLDGWTWKEILWALHYYDAEHDAELHADETSILFELDNSGEPLVKKTIASLTGLTPSTVRSRLGKLVERGYAKNSKPGGKSGFVATNKGVAYLKKRGYCRE